MYEDSFLTEDNVIEDNVIEDNVIAIGAPSPDPITDWIYFILAVIVGGVMLYCAINRK